MKKTEQSDVLEYPRRAVLLEDNTIHMVCGHCSGKGKETVWQSSSNYPGTAEGVITRTNCTFCNGTGYEPNPISFVTITRKVKGKKNTLTKRGFKIAPMLWVNAK